LLKVCRKCRRHRDQNHQQQQKRVNKDHQQNPQQITTQRVKIHAQPRVVDTGLQTDIQQQPQIINLPLALRQQNGGPSSITEQKKMCWQRERETNVERRFQYENKFRQ